MRRFVALLLVLAACFAGTARANGDPASDVLPFSNVFLSTQDPKSSDSGQQLLALTADASKQRFPIKVAVIAQVGDLGLVPSMWRKPQPYANFLGRELILFARYRGTLVVAMPNGFGVFGPGTAKGKPALGKLPQPRTSGVEQLGTAAADAVKAVGGANGHALSAPASESPKPVWLIVLAAFGGAAALAAAAFFTLRRWLLRPSAP